MKPIHHLPPLRHLILPLAAMMAMGAAAASSPLWMRDVKVSPDGKTIAFRYRGDIYTVPATGGTARRLTTTPAMERTPIWSPDGRTIAFASDRDGAMNIYVTPATGGEARRLTSGSVNLVPEAFTPAGDAVVFSAAIQDPAESLLFPTARLTELYSVPLQGGAATQLLASPAEMIFWLPDGKSFLYQDRKGMESVWRKHHTSSVTRDVWRYDAATGAHTNLTAHAGEDLNPVVSPDGKTVYFLSERDGGSMNVYSFPLSAPATVQPVSSFTGHPVRFLSMGSDGTLVYGYDGEIYTQRPGAAPSKVEVAIVDDPAPERSLIPIGNFSEAVPSPDGKEVAAVSRGNIVVSATDYSTTRQVTDNEFVQKQVQWHPDGRKLVFTSDMGGAWEIYEAAIHRDEDPNFANATLIDITPVRGAKEGVERSTPRYSPDGKKLAYVENRTAIKVMDLASGTVTQVTDGSGVTSRGDDVEFVWSPDGKWIATTVVDRRHDPYYDVALAEVATGKVTNLTSTGYFDYHPRFAMDGNAIIFYSDRRGLRSQASWGSQGDVYCIFLNQDALDRYRLSEEEYKLMKDAEKKASKDKDDDKNGSKDKGKGKGSKKSKKGEKAADAADKGSDIKVELEGIRDRIVCLTPNSSELGDFIILGDDGEETLYYLSSFEEGYDLWKRDLRKGDTRIVSKLDSPHWVSLAADKDGKTLFLSGSTVKRMGLSDSSPKPVTFSGSMPLEPAKERQAMFDYVRREEGKRFYETGMHGVDWDALTIHYSRYLPHINNNYDFAEMLSELLGELNVSHTGASFYPRGSREPSAELGVLYDLSYAGPGLKVAEVLRGTPFARASSKVRPGVVITTVQGVEITPDKPIDILLRSAAGKNTLIGLKDPATGATWEETVKPVSRASMNGALYKRWVERNRAMVDSLSGGRIGYVHLRSMSDGSYREIYSDLLGRYHDREAVVVDTRWNGGGRLHEDIEVLFSGEEYFNQVVRGQVTGSMPSRRWNKPSVMLVCEANYSNAHGTPWVYAHKKLGKTVGAPVPGTMTSVNWVDLRDDSLVFGIPVVGMRLPDGTYLENKQFTPDILVLNDPAEIVKGRDRQIEAAVAELLRTLPATPAND